MEPVRSSPIQGRPQMRDRGALKQVSRPLPYWWHLRFSSVSGLSLASSTPTPCNPECPQTLLIVPGG